MKTKLFICILALVFTLNANAQTAKDVLDKTAALVGRKGGASANFTISGNKIKPTAGTFCMKGKKFFASTPNAKVWFDGKTQWSYMQATDEVNISTPTQAEQMQANPYSFIFIYKTGYNMSMKQVGGDYEVHLVAQNQKRTVQELYITIAKDYQPKLIKMRQKQNWITIGISNFQAKNQSDATFRFNGKAYPQAEVIDLR